MRFLTSTENEILLFPVFGSFGKIFSLKMKTEIQPNTFPLLFSISSENENRKQPNQTPPKIPCRLKPQDRILISKLFKPGNEQNSRK